MIEHANASPEAIYLGADDKSIRRVSSLREPIPQHVPLIFTFAPKGTTEKIIAKGPTALMQYGEDLFDPDLPYYNHHTRLANEMFGVGNLCAMKRLVPTDAGIKANTVLYMDIVAKDVPNYVRNSLGDIVTVGGVPQVDGVTPTISGHEIKFVTETSSEATMGAAVSKAGTFDDGGGVPVQSTMYPILEFRASEQGAAYNNNGFFIESVAAADQDSEVNTVLKALQYKLGLVYRADKDSSAVTLRSLYGEPSVACTLKGGVKHPTTKLKIDIRSVFNDNWYNETDKLKSIRYKEYEDLHVYQTELATVLGMIMSAEKTHITTVPATWDDGNDSDTLGWFDFTTDDQTILDEEIYLINPFTAKASTGKPYFTLMLSDAVPTLTGTQQEVYIGRDTPVFQDGGSDGTMDNAMYETLVSLEMAKYLDPDSEVIDNAVNVETHLYDTGFTLDTKYDLLNFISVRKDTVVALGTHDAATDNQSPKVLSDIRAIAVLLKTKAKLFPESDFFGTPVARAVVMGGSMRMYSDLDNNYHTSVYELAIKTADMMGAGNYKWKSGRKFDYGRQAELKHGYDYQPAFIPAGIKPSLWAEGLVWAQPKDRKTYFIPAIQTVYDDDTSALNTWITVCALVTLNRIAGDAWRNFTGASTMDDITFKDKVGAYLNRRLRNIFDGMVVVVPDVIITSRDAALGFSWQIRYKLYAANMKTKMVTYTEVYRLSDLTA